MIKLPNKIIEELKKPIPVWLFIGIMDCIYLDNGQDPEKWRKGMGGGR